MRILILSWRGPEHPNRGGAEISTHEHAKGWVKAGHKVTLFTSYFHGAKREENIDGIDVKRYGRQMFGVQWEAFVWYLFKNHNQFDLVIDQFHGIPFFTPFYVKGKKLAFIHEVAKEVWGLSFWPKPYNFFPSTLGRVLEPLIFLFYKYIPFMTVSKSTKDDLVKWGIPNKNITIINNGISVPKNLKVFKKENEKTLIFLGALNSDKGGEDALMLFSLISTKDKMRFWIVGKGEEKYLKRLKVLCKKLNIDHQVVFYGYVDERRKFELLQRAHLLINTSIREGWGLVVIEAAYVGTPTIGYNVSGLKDSIVDNKTGLLSAPNPKDAAMTVSTLLQDVQRYKTFQINCRNWARNFSWIKSSNQSLSLLEKVIKN